MNPWPVAMFLLAAFLGACSSDVVVDAAVDQERSGLDDSPPIGTTSFLALAPVDNTSLSEASQPS